MLFENNMISIIFFKEYRNTHLAAQQNTLFVARECDACSGSYVMLFFLQCPLTSVYIHCSKERGPRHMFCAVIMECAQQLSFA